MKISKIVLFFLTSVLVSCSSEENGTIVINTPATDIDGNVYNTIIIGNQTWMVENLKTTTYNDGTPINFRTQNDDWHNGNTQIDYYQWADTNDLNNVHSQDLPEDYYGAMYNHYAVQSGKLAPQGWRIPTQQDFIELRDYLAANGFSGNEATALKSDSGWFSSSGNGTDAVGFRGLPNGYVSSVGTSTLAEGIATFITTDYNASTKKRVLVQLFNTSDMHFTENPIQIGGAVRCIRVD